MSCKSSYASTCINLPHVCQIFQVFAQNICPQVHSPLGALILEDKALVRASPQCKVTCRPNFCVRGARGGKRFWGTRIIAGHARVMCLF